MAELGKLLYQGPLLVSEAKFKIKVEKERQVFAFQSTLLFARKVELPGQAKFKYECKFKIPVSQYSLPSFLLPFPSPPPSLLPSLPPSLPPYFPPSLPTSLPPSLLPSLPPYFPPSLPTSLPPSLLPFLPPPFPPYFPHPPNSLSDYQLCIAVTG